MARDDLDHHEVPLKRVPSLEAALSRWFTTLSDIQATHRRFRPELLAEAYESQLRKLTTSLADYGGRHGCPKNWPGRLNLFHLVVEGEAGPLMLSLRGQFITPAGILASLRISFISDNMAEARNTLDQCELALEEEKKLTAQCIQEVNPGSHVAVTLLPYYDNQDSPSRFSEYSMTILVIRRSQQLT
jgi:Domain of unknown function (DUF4461)